MALQLPDMNLTGLWKNVDYGLLVRLYEEVIRCEDRTWISIGGDTVAGANPTLVWKAVIELIYGDGKDLEHGMHRLLVLPYVWLISAVPKYSGMLQIINAEKRDKKLWEIRFVFVHTTDIVSVNRKKIDIMKSLGFSGKDCIKDKYMGMEKTYESTIPIKWSFVG